MNIANGRFFDPLGPVMTRVTRTSESERARERSCVPKGALVGIGRTAEVFDWEDGWVLKLYCAPIPRAWVEHEAELGRIIHGLGIPAPAVREVVELEGRVGCVFERVPGPSLVDRVKRRPWQAAEVGRFLARLHRRVHLATVPPRQLPCLAERIAGNIREVRELLGDDSDRVLARIEALPADGVLCHFDFHPGNVLGVGDRVQIIDWLTAGIGPPAMDVARTLLILESPFPPPGLPLLLHPVMRHVRRIVASAYFAEYFALSGLSRAEVDAWLISVAAARLWEKVPGERDWLLDIVRAGAGSLGAPASALSRRRKWRARCFRALVASSLPPPPSHRSAHGSSGSFGAGQALPVRRQPAVRFSTVASGSAASSP